MIIFWLLFSVLTAIALIFVIYPLVRVNKSKPNIPLAIFLATLLMIAAVSVYLKSGYSRQLTEYYHVRYQASTIAKEITQLGSVENIIARLKQRMSEHPDGQGWYLLGRLYLKSQKFPEAVAAFASAHHFQADRPDILVSYAQALYFANDQTLSPQAKKMLNRALLLQPGQIDAIHLLELAGHKKE